MTTQTIGAGVMHDDAPRRPGRPARPVTRDHLLKVAREAFAELGYAGASMGDIAARAGIRKSSLFHHFATKDDLYRDALATVVNDIGAQVRDAVQSEGTILDRMDNAAYAVQRYFGEHPVAARLLIREFVDGGSAVTAAAGEAVDLVLRETAQILETCMNEGLIPRQDPRQLTMSIVGVHFMFFSVPSVTARFIGADTFAQETWETRAKLVVEHLRRLVGAPQKK